MRKVYSQQYSKINNKQVNVQILNASIDYIFDSNRFTGSFNKASSCSYFSLFLLSVHQSKRNGFAPKF